MNGMLSVDAKKCMGCYACEIACKEVHGIPPEKLSWIKVVRSDAASSEAEKRGHYLLMVCVHCASPPCVEACPEGVIAQREDGIVLIDSADCTGCELCMEACPYGAIFFSEEDGVAFKCDLCLERVERELWPSCVQHCFAQAFCFEPVG
ncbi:MAG: 4Fe-4S ferredoxin [Chloroflexi bacterium B3_Chlor]|nr:MAG: 4Fe-4S ferredoxin [Chloroflexi bacterium B3_Chlor]